MAVSSRPLEISTAPFLHEGTTTSRLMWEVLFVLIPVAVVAWYFFGLSALLIPASSSAGAVLLEWLISRKSGRGSTLSDGSALLTGLLLGFTLPPTIPMWMAFVGGIVAIGLGKLIWGGLGRNIFNPALVGRAFLQGAFPDAMTTWMAPPRSFVSLQPTTLAWPFMGPSTDIVTTASPLGLAKFDNQTTELVYLLFGNTSGCIGETCALLLVGCGVWLVVRRVADWRLLLSPLIAAALTAGVLHLVRPGEYEDPLFALFAGGLMFGAVFMCTDPVTTPITPRGSWIFGAGVGFLVVILRLFGGLPESVMYSILLMNAVTPLINRFTQPRQFGARR